MRIFGPCSSPQLLMARTLRTLLALLLAAHLSSAMFDDCDGKDKRCIVHANCHADATKVDPNNQFQLVMQKDVKSGGSCYDGIEISIVKTADESKWTLFLGINPTRIEKPVLKLTTDAATNLDDIVLDGKTDGNTWEINNGPVKFSVTLEAKNAPSSTAHTYLLTLTAPAGKHVPEELNLVEKDLKVCIAGVKAGSPVEECSAPFFFFTHACDKERFDCGPADRSCNDINYRRDDLFSKAVLQCIPDHTLVLGDKAVFKKATCTADKGWDGNAPDDQPVAFVDHRAPGFDHEAKLPIRCKPNCDPTLRKLTGRFNTNVNNQLSCANDKHIMKIIGKQEIRTAETMECVEGAGWKDATTKNKLIVSFAEDGAFLNAECVESCTADLIESSCSAVDTTKHGCEAPVFNALKNNHIGCKDRGSILHVEKTDTFHKYGIVCSRDAFIVAPTTIQRINFMEKIRASCVAKCHDSYTSNEKYRGCVANPRKNECVEDTKDSSGTRTLKCVGADHYLQIVGKRGISATCDPDKGWTSDKGELIVVFDHNKYEIKPNCLNACDHSTTDTKKNRLQKECPSDVLQEFCAQFVYTPRTKKYECPNTHLMRAKGVEMLNEKLTCSREGIKRDKDGSLLYTFDPQNYQSKHPLQCVDKCHKIFIESDSAVDSDTHKELKCRFPNNVLMISQPPAAAKRVFGPVTCDENGWKDGTNPVAPFTTTVHIKAECISVCEREVIEDACTNPAESRCKKIELENYVASVLSCRSPTHVLFFNGVEVAESAKCAKGGWKNDPDTGAPLLIDNNIAGTTLPQKVSVECRHKCHKDFVVNSCDGQDAISGSCTQAKYDEKEGLLTCNDPLEIFSIASDGNSPRESYSESVKCTDNGWMDKENQLVLDPTKFTVQVKCVHVCHETTLNNADPNKRGYQYSDEAKAWKLTCKEQAEMLEFNADPASGNPSTALYSDAQCSKAGWKKSDASGTMLVSFTPGTARPALIDANCVLNKCTNTATGSRISPTCPDTPDPNDLCDEPNMGVKYYMSCAAPLVIVKTGVSSWYDALYCKDGKWFDIKAPNPEIIAADAPLQTKCSAGACAGCDDDLKRIALGADTNWQDIKFTKGKSHTCSSYGCADGAYKVIDGSGKATYYPRDPLKKIACSKTQKYVTPDEMIEIGADMKVGCVRKIPCDEHTPLSHECTTGVRAGVSCDPNMPSLLKLKNNGGAPLPVTCSNDDYEMYRFISGEEWEPLTSIVCNAKGGWTATPVQNPDETVELRKDDRVICADADPNKQKGPAPEPICEACARVLNSQKKKCDECLDKEGDFTYELKGQKCVAKSSTGVITFDADQVTYEPVTCKAKKDKNGAMTYKWYSSKDQQIGAVAAKLGKPPASFSKGALAGIIVGCLFVCALVGAGLGYVYYSKKKKAKQIEEQKSKGLTQKIDSIIDEQTVPDDVKTLVL